MMAKSNFFINRLSAGKISTESGVYLFKTIAGAILYIGKAKNLRNRVSSYFSGNLEYKTRSMVSKANSVETLTVGSEFEAMLLEARLINKFRPKYNIELRDDKSPIYIVATKDTYPLLKVVRKKDLNQLKLYWGPFLSARETRIILKTLRQVFPFSDHKVTARPCIYSQIGLCSPCPSLINQTADAKKRLALRKLYLVNFRRVKNILNGKLRFVEKELVSEMKNYSKAQEFEAAGEVRNKLVLFQSLTAKQFLRFDYFENPNLREDIAQREISELKKLLLFHGVNVPVLSRIECFDISHLSGTNAAASMVVFLDGIADKSSYRRFKIRSASAKSDFDSIKEVIRRRMQNTSWGLPDLIIVDGGKPQVSAATQTKHLTVPVVGIAKRNETLVIKKRDIYEEVKLAGFALNLVQKMRDEAHRFARNYHHKLVEMLLKNIK